MSRKTVNDDAPSTVAASIMLGGIVRKKLVSMYTEKGSISPT